MGVNIDFIGLVSMKFMARVYLYISLTHDDHITLQNGMRSLVANFSKTNTNI